MKEIKAGSQRSLSSAVLVALLAANGIVSAHAASPAPTSPAQASSAPSTAAPSPSTSGAASPTPKKHGLTQAQRDALSAAQTTYKSSVQSALDGANKAIADARSIRDQAVVASPKDKNVRALANSDFKNSSIQIWTAFKASVAQAKSTYDAAVASIKAGN